MSEKLINDDNLAVRDDALAYLSTARLEKELRRRGNIMTLHGNYTTPMDAPERVVDAWFFRQMAETLWAERIIASEPSKVRGPDGLPMLDHQCLFSVYKFQPFTYKPVEKSDAESV